MIATNSQSRRIAAIPALSKLAVDPASGRRIIVEMNPRVSRSSALASKATGFPIAKVAAKLAVGYTLDELDNDITRVTPASFEPTIDYVVTKVPRFTFEKFPQAEPVLGTQMKSVGEVMAIGGTFQESLQKALRGLETGVDGLLRDKTRPSRIPKLSDEKVAEVIRRTTEEAPPDGGTHWTVRAMAAATGVSRAKVHGIWREAGLVPHRWRQFKLSNDPAFVEKVEDVVGLYVDPPEHAVVLSIDEKSQIQALDRTQPGLPMKRGRLGTMTHDYKRHGTTTLFAALNTLTGEVFERNMARHRHQEFLRFLKTIEAGVPEGMASTVLTVSDTNGFAHQGVIINLIKVDNKIRFEINPAAAERAGLKISSHLLRLARIVE